MGEGPEGQTPEEEEEEARRAEEARSPKTVQKHLNLGTREQQAGSPGPCLVAQPRKIENARSSRRSHSPRNPVLIDPRACHASLSWCGRRCQQEHAQRLYCTRAGGTQRESPQRREAHTQTRTKPKRSTCAGEVDGSKTDCSSQTTKDRLSGRLSRCSDRGNRKCTAQGRQGLKQRWQPGRLTHPGQGLERGGGQTLCACPRSKPVRQETGRRRGRMEASRVTMTAPGNPLLKVALQSGQGIAGNGPCHVLGGVGRGLAINKERGCRRQCKQDLGPARSQRRHGLLNTTKVNRRRRQRARLTPMTTGGAQA